MKYVRRWLLIGWLALAWPAAETMAQDAVDAPPPATPADAATRAAPAESSTPALELSAAERAAYEAAQGWLRLVDSKAYPKSFEEAAAVIRTSFGQDKWVRAIRAALPPLGEKKSRVLVSSEHLDGMPGGAAGEYVQLRYVSSYANKPEAEETVTLYLERGVWRVAGYFVK